MEGTQCIQCTHVQMHMRMHLRLHNWTLHTARRQTSIDIVHCTLHSAQWHSSTESTYAPYLVFVFSILVLVAVLFLRGVGVGASVGSSLLCEEVEVQH